MRNTYILITNTLLLIIIVSCNATSESVPDLIDRVQQPPIEVVAPIEKEKLHQIPSSTFVMEINGKPKTLKEVSFNWNRKEEKKTEYSVGSSTYSFENDGNLLNSIDTTLDAVFRSEYAINKSKGSVTVSKTNLNYEIGSSETHFFYNDFGKLDSVFTHVDGDRDFYETTSYNENEKIESVKHVFVKTKLSSPEITLSTYSYLDSIINIEVVNLSSNEDVSISKVYNTNGDCTSITSNDGGIVDITVFSYQYDSLQNWVVLNVLDEGEIIQVIERNYTYYE